MKKTVFFFGAGASAAEGAPIASSLLYEAFNKMPNNRKVNNVIKFIQRFYNTKVNGNSNMPNFEEILSPIDICIQKNQCLSSDYNLDYLRNLKGDLIYCICAILDKKLRRVKGFHKEFIQSLYSLNDTDNWRKFSFISLNYDILLDNALLRLTEKENFVDVDYAIEFRNEGINWSPPRDRHVHLLKLHGSLNWIYCPTCNSVKITPYEKGVMEIFTDFHVCEYDDSQQEALIIPPTWQKVYDNQYLVAIWLKAERELRKAEKVVFIGYSLPESDVHIKYLLKKSLFRPDSELPEIVVIDKGDNTKDSEEFKRYQRLFGEIDYRPIGFEAYINEQIL